MTANTTGSTNTAVGFNAMEVNTTGSNNTAVGDGALNANTTADESVAIGRQALVLNTTGAQNTACGANALDECTTGSQNTAVGRQALDGVTTGSNNTAVGRNSGYELTTGNHNIILGRNAGNTLTTGSYNILIGDGNASGGSNDSAQITIGTDLTGKGSYYTSFGTNANGRVYNYYPSNATWTRDSDERLKKDIQTNTDCGLDFIKDLRTVTYKWKAPSEMPQEFVHYKADQTEAVHKEKMYGFIAQEVKSILDKHNITDFNGWTVDNEGVQGISYEMFVMPLIKAVHELSAKVETLQSEINALKGG